jgi:hypothetical protein
VRRAKTWEILSITRLILLIVLALVLFTGLTKANNLAEVSTGRKKGAVRLTLAH